MSFRAALHRALWGSMLAVLLGGCSSLPFFTDRTKDEAAAVPATLPVEAHPPRNPSHGSASSSTAAAPASLIC